VMTGENTGIGTDRVRDPVCGREVDPTRTEWKSPFAGTTYSFCSPRCQERFLQHPARYAHAPACMAPWDQTDEKKTRGTG